MRMHVIIIFISAALLPFSTLRAEENANASLVAAARACGDLAIAANPAVDPKVVPDKAHDIFAMCKLQWQRVAIATIESEANDKITNFRNRRDAQKLYQEIGATSIRLESEEEARLRDAMRAAIQLKSLKTH